jgi:N-acyl-D-aspartate/D-glutamate deacylase
VRDRQIMSLERAVARLTSEPARFFGIRKRGVLAPRMAADIVIFDAERVGSASRTEMRNDLPGGGRRLVIESQGIQQTIVNGEIVHDHGRYTGNTSGQVLRSGAA